MQQEKTEQPALHLIYESSANAALWTKNQTKPPTLVSLFFFILPHEGKLWQRICVFTLPFITSLQCRVNGIEEST